MNVGPALRDLAAALIGVCEVTDLLGPAVARVTTRDGHQYVVKQHATQDKHDREVHAYRHWTTALGQAAPNLIAADPHTRAIITTALPGQPHTGTPAAATHHRAGTLLHRFHAAEPPRLLSGYRTWLRDRSEHWLDQARPFLGRADLAVVTAHLDALRETAAPAGVPCHLDFQDRNWLHDRVGNVYLIDFEHARTDHALRDLVRLRFRVWPARPDLREAFLAGYEQDLTDDDNQTLLHFGALDALTAIARGHQAGDTHLTASGHATLRQLPGA